MSDRITGPFQRPMSVTEYVAGFLPVPRAEFNRRMATVWDFITDTRRDLMSAVDDMVARFAAATDEIASDLDALRAEVANLDAGVAAKFEPLVTRLESLGADPQNPVPPAPEPPVA